jgi:hypothetical protein
VDLSRLEQRLLTVKKVEEGRFVSARTKTSCCEEGGRREKVENMDLSRLEQRLLAMKKVEEG